MEMRPRFALEVPLEPSEVQARLESQAAAPESACQTVVVGKHVEVTIRPERRHFWSPHLSLELNPGPGGSVLQGLFGPSPNVWTLFLAAYGFLVLSAFFAGVLGLVQLSLGQPAWGLAVAGGSLAACAIPFAAAQVGRGLAAEQMEELRVFLTVSLGLQTDDEGER